MVAFAGLRTRLPFAVALQFCVAFCTTLCTLVVTTLPAGLPHLVDLGSFTYGSRYTFVIRTRWLPTRTHIATATVQFHHTFVWLRFVYTPRFTVLRFTLQLRIHTTLPFYVYLSDTVPRAVPPLHTVYAHLPHTHCATRCAYAVAWILRWLFLVADSTFTLRSIYCRLRHMPFCYVTRWLRFITLPHHLYSFLRTTVWFVTRFGTRCRFCGSRGCTHGLPRLHLLYPRLLHVYILVTVYGYGYCRCGYRLPAVCGYATAICTTVTHARHCLYVDARTCGLPPRPLPPHTFTYLRLFFLRLHIRFFTCLYWFAAFATRV